MNKKIFPYLSLLAVYTIFGFSFLFSKMALNHVSPLTLVAVRFLVALVVMSVLLLFRVIRINLKGKPVWKVMAMGMVQPVVYFICESYGIQMTSASFSGVMLGLLPVFGLVAGAIFFREKATPFKILCVFLSVLGVALTTVGGEVDVSILGTFLLLGAVLSATLFSVMSKSISSQFTSIERTYVMFIVGSVVFFLMALVENKGDVGAIIGSLKNGEVAVSILYLSVISSICAFLLLNYALNYVETGTQTLYSNFCTVVSVPAGILIMGDTFSLPQILGVIIILFSVIGVSLEKK